MTRSLIIGRFERKFFQNEFSGALKYFRFYFGLKSHVGFLEQ
jgi:hypothetical protein